MVGEFLIISHIMVKQHHQYEICAWQVQEIQKAVQKADSPQAKFFSHQQIEEWVESWNTPNELKPLNFP